MDDVVPFGLAIVVVSVAGLLAVWSNRVSQRVRIPAPAFFFAAAAVSAGVVSDVGRVDVVDVQRIVTVCLLVLLFDGGMHIGEARLRTATAAVLWLGVAGTAVTAAGVAVLAHLAFSLDWRSALLIGVALSPTDPAVVFSVLGRREIGGRSGTLLEGESGANDPVGIAAMAAVLGAGGSAGWGEVANGVGEFAGQMFLGGVIGLVGGWALSVLMRRMPLPSGALYPLQALLAAGAIYGLATVVHGSGFLAVFVAGIVVGDVRAPYKGEIERFHSSLASLAEIVAFAVLGLTVTIGDFATDDRVLVGLGMAVLLMLVVRPVLVGLLLLPIELSRGERVFVLWSGLKGAVPLLLGTFLLSAGVDDAERLYGVVVVVVVVSVVLQGGSVPTVARWTGVPMRTVEPEPWALGMRFRDEPAGLRRYSVEPGAPADGTSLADLPLGEGAWISMISREGSLVAVRGETVLRAMDEVLLLADPRTDAELDDLFTSREPPATSDPPER